MHNEIRLKQRGATLIVALLLLLVVTMVGVSSVKTSAVEEKMSGSFRDHQLAFEAAELALLEGEKFVENTAFSFASYTAACPSGLCFVGTWDSANPDADCSLSGTADDIWLATANSDVWSDNNKHKSAVVTLQGINQAPKYIIEFLCHAPTSESTVLTPYVNGNGWEAQFGTLFRITALGTGGSNDARVMLQSTYLKP